MAEATERLLLQVDAATGLLRRNLLEAETPLSQFEQRAGRMAANVDKSIASMGSRFGEFSKLAESAADRAQRAFEDSFSDVQKLAAKAIQAPTVTGGLNVGASDAKAAAGVAQQRAAATRLIAEAAERAAQGEGVLTEQTRLYVQAARAATIEAERQANELSKEAGALERLEIELMQAGAASRVFAGSQRMVVAQTGAQRAAMAGLSYQVQDTFTQLSMGANVFQVLAIQGGQAAGQFANVEGKAGNLAKFLIGPWGLAITGAALLGGPLVEVVKDFVTESGKAAGAAEVHRKANELLKEAVDRLNGSQASLNHTTRQGIQDDLNAAEAKRQHIIRTRQLIDAQLVEAKRGLSASLETQANSGGTAPGLQAGVAGLQAQQARQKISAIEGAQKLNDAKMTEANTAIVAGRAQLVMRKVAASTDAATAATQRYEDAIDGLSRKFERGGFGNPNSLKAQDAFQAAAERETRQRDSSLAIIRDGKKRGPSADTLARRAEVVRQREIAEDTAYSDEERGLRRRLLEATRRTAESEESRDALLRDDIQSEYDAQRRKIANQQKAGKLDGEQAETLNQLNDRTRTQRLENVEIERRAARLTDSNATAQQSLDIQIASAQIETDMARTLADRREIELRILDLQDKREKQIQQAVLDDPRSTEGERTRARAAIGAVDATAGARRQQVQTRNASPLEGYRDQLTRAADDIDVALENVGVSAFRGLEDSMLSVIDGTRSVGDAFGDMAKSIISDLARIAIQAAILKAVETVLPGAGSFLGFLKRSDGGPIERRAGGGMIAGPGGPRDDVIPALLSNGEFVVNAAATARHRSLLEAVNSNRLPKFATGGLVSPSLPSLREPTLSKMIGNGRAAGGLVEHRVKVDVAPSEMFETRVQQQTIGIVSASAEPIMAGAEARTRRSLSRPALPGGAAW